ncbi:MAG: hypothetical protein WD708_02370 [Kiritimatiellia bacterium]
MKAQETKTGSEKVHFRDVVVGGAASGRIATPLRLGVESFVFFHEERP